RFTASLVHSERRAHYARRDSHSDDGGTDGPVGIRTLDTPAAGLERKIALTRIQSKPGFALLTAMCPGEAPCIERSRPAVLQTTGSKFAQYRPRGRNLPAQASHDAHEGRIPSCCREPASRFPHEPFAPSHPDL